MHRATVAIAMHLNRADVLAAWSGFGLGFTGWVRVRVRFGFGFGFGFGLGLGFGCELPLPTLFATTKPST